MFSLSGIRINRVRTNEVLLYLVLLYDISITLLLITMDISDITVLKLLCYDFLILAWILNIYGLCHSTIQHPFLPI